MQRNKTGQWYSSLWKSTKGIAIPVTFLMLFVSLTIIVSATYFFAVTQINVNNQEVKITTAKQRMLSLEDTIQSLLWSPGSYEIYEFEDLGGKLKVDSAAKRLVMNLTDNAVFYDVFFNSYVGKVAYQMPTIEDATSRVYVKGDNRVIVNQSSATMTQLYIGMGTTSPEITLSYRPLAGATVTEQDGGKPTNLLRIYVVNLNSSETVTMQGKFRIKLSCVNVTSAWRNYDFSSQLTVLTLKVSLDGTSDAVALPITSNVNGALVDLETVICNVKIQSAGVS